MSVVFMPAEHTHSIEMGDDSSVGFHLELPSIWLAKRGVERLPPYTLERGGGPLLWLAQRLEAELRRPDHCSNLAIEGIALEMLAHLLRHQPREAQEPVWLCRARKLIQDEFRRPLTVQRIASAVGVHPVHLSRVYKRYHQGSVLDELRRVRVRHACQRIQDSNIPLADLALDAGFSDQSQLTRAFKRLLGTTPARYRAAMRQAS